MQVQACELRTTCQEILTQRCRPDKRDMVGMVGQKDKRATPVQPKCRKCRNLVQVLSDHLITFIDVKFDEALFATIEPLINLLHAVFF